MPNDWTPFQNRTEFETAEFFFIENQTPAAQINRLLDLWALTLVKHDDRPLFADHCDLYKTIDNIPVDIPPPQMDQTFDNMLSNPDYIEEFDYCPYREFSTDGDVQQWKDFMSGDWAWDQADLITSDPETHGSTFVPVILGSVKTMLNGDASLYTIATGNNEYYPLYASIGNVHNNVRRAHQEALAIIRFLAIPKIVRFGNGHFRRVIYGLGPYIADYKEQVLLACIVQGWHPRCLGSCNNLDEPASECCREHTEALVKEATLGDLWDTYGIAFTNDYPQADIHELIAPDLLHQLIKSTFKDHIINWIKKIAATPSFAGLRRFSQGCRFKQWTGDDSKVLMKVYLPAIEGHVPTEVVQTFRAFLEFCYLHHIHLIRLFGAPNGLCSSITESKHIKAVKEPWWRQMLVTNQCLDKLAAAWTDFMNCGMLSGTCFAAAINALHKSKSPGNLLPPNAECEVGVREDGDVKVDTGPTVIQVHVELAKTPLSKLALELSIPQLPNMLSHFLFAQLNLNDPRDPSEVPLATCPQYDKRINIFNSACSRFFAPSDLSGIGGMHREHIHACPAWRKEHPRYDCIFVNVDPDLDRMRGMNVARVLTFFSFTYRTEIYPNSPDEDTGMWVVRPAHHANHAPNISIIHVDLIYRAAHLIPVYGSQFISLNLWHYQTYDSFQKFYVNKYADHHAFEIAS
ncbi:hypothetical protein P692DRAFT_201841927 [Suillus brevipes Sb2]|nr:hypothetical protein P692DRAFT_201841927 [Suillus brevipes Sb2]